MENSFMHRGCVVSMSAIKKEDDGESPHIEVAMSIEEVATGQVLFSETDESRRWRRNP